MRYRKRPVIVDVFVTDEPMEIETLEGTMHASPGDYVITGVKGERYPCKPDIFERTYEPVDDEDGCDFESGVTEDEPPYNLYSLYESVFRRSPRNEYVIEDDEIEKLVDELLDICNVPGHDIIKACDTAASDPTEHGIDSIYDWCFAAIEGADGAEDELYCSIMRAIEDYRHPERATAHTMRTVDRDALLTVAKGLDSKADDIMRAAQHARFSKLGPTMDQAKFEASEWRGVAHRIREALEVCDCE